MRKEINTSTETMADLKKLFTSMGCKDIDFDNRYGCDDCILFTFNDVRYSLFAANSQDYGYFDIEQAE